ncbi:Armadillo-type fold [Pseudocohnilembus persalinus]|uniref:Armadillo-type fold n=1 Tax=Pseudocohnilembus persalinus TaxID=266149 RepID=A0A0V0QDC8_PSEPJ|nr:Armadillo-type fold [Pseudocohnilembus persalinus]|eukprot:KRX00211.1 Armadillo-type fold [Pseudocohnilembus persalinus]
MQSYKIHVVSEHLKDRYPYLELPFRERLDKTEVYDAVFDRAIPKLVEILLMPNIEHYKYRDAFITLNEQVSHQENKDMMISEGLVGIASAYLQHKVVEIRREAVLLLGSLCSIKRGRDFLDETSYEGLKFMILDDNLQAREACQWAICRIVSGRDGVEQIVKSELVKDMISSFLKHAQENQVEEARYLIMLLESFLYVLQYDDGIQFFLKKNVVQRLNEMLKNEKNTYFDESLDCLSKIAVNFEGKEEIINHKVIDTASKYLESEEIKEIQYAVILIMNAAIHLEGKKQCTYVKNDFIITKLINLLTNDNYDFEGFMLRDIQQTLKNISELPDGFYQITKILANNVEKLNEVFGPSVILSLAQLLPKTSELARPPFLDEKKADEYKVYAKTICEFILKTPDDLALIIAFEDTVKIVEKIVVFLIYNSEQDEELFHMTMETLTKLCSADQSSLQTLQDYLKEYGDFYHPYTGVKLNDVVENYKDKTLLELLQGKY